HASAVRALIAEFCGLHRLQFYLAAQSAALTARAARATTGRENSNAAPCLFYRPEPFANHRDGGVLVPISQSVDCKMDGTLAGECCRPGSRATARESQRSEREAEADGRVAGDRHQFAASI